MKRLILFEILILFLATTFESDSPPGWFQQTLPVNDQITDIFFLDSLNGWIGSRKAVNDTARVLYTSNGGTNWVIQYSYVGAIFNAIQFLNNNTGYAAGGDGFGAIFKTTNGGNNWNLIYTAGHLFIDLFFVNENTGWICDEDPFFGAGLLKTTNGGISWIQQLNRSFKSSKLYFLNKDTGWVGTQEINSRLFRTTNGGVNWNLQYTFTSTIGDVNFLNKNFGIVTAGNNQRTYDGGFTWIPSENSFTGLKLAIVSDSIAYAGLNWIYVVKTNNGGRSWFYQYTYASNPSIFAIDSLNVWAGGNKLMHTTDGGGPPVGIIYASSEVSNYKLNQNFPNPFNPTTIIFFKLQEKSTVELLVYNILGEEVAEMVDDDHFTAGVYQFGFDASKYDLPSGVYFYRLTAKSEVSDNIFMDTKKMLLIK